MKKLLGILVLGLMLVSSPSNSGSIGTGELTLSESSVKWFIKYLRGGHGNKPLKFLITTDGEWPHYWFCPVATCTPGGDNTEIKVCEQKTKRECKVFARSRTIKWKNGINKGNRESKFNSKWSDAEIRAKLTELGFLGEATSTTTKVEKKKETGDIFPTNAGKTTFKKKTMEDLVYLNNKKRTKDVKEHWKKKYPDYKGYKAWAESPNRAWSWRSSSMSEEDAITQAVDRCNTYEADPLCVVTKVGDKHLTYQEQADWMQKIYGRTTLAAKLISKNKVEKKKETKKKTNEDIVQKLKDLKELYDDGALTKEEYTKAKNKLLN